MTRQMLVCCVVSVPALIQPRPKKKECDMQGEVTADKQVTTAAVA